MTRVTNAPDPVELRPGPIHLSFSQLSLLDPSFRYACARKWAYRYRINLPEDRSPAMVMGSAFDEACNCYFELRREGVEGLESAAKAAEVGIAWIQQEAAGLGEPSSVAELLMAKLDDYEALFMSGWAAFLTLEGTRDVALIQAQHQFTMRIGDRLQAVVGYSDRVDRDGTLVDHKWSGSPRWSQEGVWHEEYVTEKRQQLVLYWLARRAEEKRLGHPLDPPLTGKARLVVVHNRLGLVKPQVRALDIELDLDMGDELLAKLAGASDMVAKNHFPARPGPACGFCSHLGRCRDDERERGTPFDTLIGVPF